MPARKKGIRLWLRARRRDRSGTARRATWIILDGNRHIATGCAESEITAAEGKLAEYVAAKYRPPRKARDIEQIDIADVLSVYEEDFRDRQANRAKFNGRLQRLNDFWGGRKLAEITGQSCRDYVAARDSDGGARRDLEDLRAAINHHAKEGFHRGVVRVTLPARGRPRTRWLTRKEAADLLRVCWRRKEVQTVHRGAAKGLPVETVKRPLRHLVRFILIGLYTGSRAAAIAAASPHKGAGRSYVDLDEGIFYRLPEGNAETNKRQPRYPFLLGFSHTSGVGSKRVWSKSTSWNGTASVCARSRHHLLRPYAWRVWLDESLRTRCVTRRRPGSCRLVSTNGKPPGSSE